MIAAGHGLDVLDAYQLVPDPALPDHVPGGQGFLVRFRPQNDETQLAKERMEVA